MALSRGRARLHRRLPLALPVHVNAGSGEGAADHCGWLAPARRAEAVGAWLAQAVGGSTLMVRSADPDWPSVMLPAGARVMETTACPRVSLPGDGPSSSFARQLRRFGRRLARDGVRFRWVAPGELDERVLAALFALHGRARVGGSSFGPEQLAFHRRLVARAERERGPAAVVAHRGDAIVGILYGFWWAETFAAYQSGWDRAYARDGLGNVLILQALELAGERGARTFDFLRGREPYKYRFGARDREDRTWLVPHGPVGALLMARRALRERRARGS